MFLTAKRLAESEQKSTKVLVAALLAWLGLFTLAFLNGTLRELGIKRFIAEPWAHHLSALTAIIIFAAFVWSIWSRLGIYSARVACKVGIFWLLLTVLAETLVLGRWLGHGSWPTILSSYDLAGGSLWPLVLIWVAILPRTIWSLRGNSGAVAQTEHLNISNWPTSVHLAQFHWHF